MPFVLSLSQPSYVAVALFAAALGLTRRFTVTHTLILMAVAVSVLANGLQTTLAQSGMDNQWLNTIWPRFQGGLFLAALSTGKRWRILAFAAPPAISTWLMVLTNGSSPMTEKMVELSVFMAVALLAARQFRTDPLISWALLVYSIPTIIASPFLIVLANLEAWVTWLDVFQIVHAGRIAGITLCAVWFWRSTAPTTAAA